MSGCASAAANPYSPLTFYFLLLTSHFLLLTSYSPPQESPCSADGFQIPVHPVKLALLFGMLKQASD
jgi:hypothetical protein